MKDQDFIKYTKEHPETVLQALYPDRLTAFYQNNNMQCFKPGNHTHGDKTPSMKYYPDTKKFKCFVCGFNWDSLDIIKDYYNLDNFKEILSKAREIYNIDPGERTTKQQRTGTREEQSKAMKIEKTELKNDNIADYILKVSRQIETPEAIAYLNQRLISLTAAKKYKIGYDKFCKLFGKPQPALIIPTTNHSYVARRTDIKADSEEERANKVRHKGKDHIFNLREFKEADTETPVFITEGEIDSLTYIQHNTIAISPGGAGKWKLITAETKDLKEKRKFIIAFDNDTTGETTAANLEAELKSQGHTVTRASFKGHDPNAALIKDSLAFFNSIKNDIETINELLTAEEEEAKEEYINKYAAINSINEFLKLREENKKGDFIKTGFNNLDKILYKGLHNEFYILGGESSTGKTSFIQMIADNIAQQGRHVLIFSLENGKHDLIAKSLSRLTYILNKQDNENRKIYYQYATTQQGLIYGLENEETESQQEARNDLIKRAIKKYSEYANNIFIYSQNGQIKVEDITAATKEHIDKTGIKPVIIVDYLQILGTREKRTDKDKYDFCISELMSIRKNYNLPVICISSLNRDSIRANKKGMQSFLGSSNIEYSADTILMLESFNEQEEELFIAEEPGNRKITIRIIKNRNGGITPGNKPIIFEYNPRFNYFWETEEE